MKNVVNISHRTVCLKLSTYTTYCSSTKCHLKMIVAFNPTRIYSFIEIHNWVKTTDQLLYFNFFHQKYKSAHSQSKSKTIVITCNIIQVACELVDMMT